MVAVCIRIDNRETDLYSQIDRIYSSDHVTELSISKEPLHIGDVIIEMMGEQKYQMVFERKTFQDLAASIKDGRYKEQKARLLSNYSPNCVTYILEDISTYRIWCSNSTHFHGLSKAVYQGVLINSLYRDQIRMYVSKDTEETARFLLGFAKKLVKDPRPYIHGDNNDNGNRNGNGNGEGDVGTVVDSNVQESHATATANGAGFLAGGGGEYIDYCQIKDRKIENITPRTAFMLQLGQIPGISRKLASSISEKYASMRDMIQAIEKLEEHMRIKELESINLIGKKKALVILQYLGF